MRRDAMTVANWDFDRIIPCHGVRKTVMRIYVTSDHFWQDVIETDGNKSWRALYSAFIN